MYWWDHFTLIEMLGCRNSGPVSMTMHWPLCNALVLKWYLNNIFNWTMAFMTGFFSAWVRSDNKNDQSVMDGRFLSTFIYRWGHFTLIEMLGCKNSGPVSMPLYWPLCNALVLKWCFNNIFNWTKAFMAGIFSAWLRSYNLNDQSVVDVRFLNTLILDVVPSR